MLKTKNTILRKDVVVIGGGTAGCFAAVSAADAGAQVLLIEKNSVLGGTMTSCGICFPGLFYAWGRQIIGGHCWNFIKTLESLGKARIPEMVYQPENHWDLQIPIDRFTTACLLDEMCEKHGVEVWLHTMLASVEEHDDGVDVWVAAKEGLQHIRAGVIVDTTGDANAVCAAGYDCLRSPSLQPATLAIKLVGYDPKVLDRDRVLAAVDPSDLPQWVSEEKVWDCLVRQNMDFHIPCCLTANTSKGRTQVEQEARRAAYQMLRAINRIPGLERVGATFVALECGVRETVRINGEYIITAEDYLAGSVFEDSVCYAFYPIDLHLPVGIKMEFLEKEVVPTVPYRALIPKSSRYILAAGRIVSSDADANSALRVEACCMAQGQAAGCAAALAVRGGRSVSQVDIAELKEELIRQGAIVPD